MGDADYCLVTVVHPTVQRKEPLLVSAAVGGIMLCSNQLWLAGKQMRHCGKELRRRIVGMNYVIAFHYPG